MALSERDRWGLWLPVALGLGVAVYFALPVEPPLFLGFFLVSVCIAAILARRLFSDGALVALIGLMAMSLGFAVATWRTAQVGAPVLEKRLSAATLEGLVSKVERQPKAIRLTIGDPRISGVHPGDTPAQVRVRLAGSQPAIVPGDWIRVRAILGPPSPPSAPGAFDFQRHAYFKQLGGTGFSLGRAQVTKPAAEADQGGIRLFIEQGRAALSLRIQAALPGQVGAIAAALMTGDRSAIDAKTMGDIRNSGLAHLLAISGLHIGLVAGIIFFMVRAGLALLPRIALSFAIKKWAAIAAIAAAFAYAQIAGATVPTQRAFLMVGLVLLAVVVDRRGLSLRLVAWAAAAILLLQPEAVLSASFQLSFAAVTALIAVYEALRRREKPRGPRRLIRSLARYAGGVALSTVIAGAATAPFALYHFNHIALYSVAANVIAVPLTALWVMPWAVLAFVLMPLGLEQWALGPMGLGVQWVAQVAEQVSAWPGGQLYLPAMPTLGLAAAALGGLWLALWARPWRFAGVPVLTVGLASVAFVAVPDVMIDGRGKLMAVKGAEGRLLFSNARAGGFERETWLHRAGFPSQKPMAWPRLGAAAPGDGLTCDRAGCVYKAKGRTVALVKAVDALAEDCWAADVVVSVEPVRRWCPASGGVIDRFDVWRDGAHAVWLGDTIRIESVNGARGDRPWVLKRRRK